MAVQINAAARLRAAVVLTDADAKKIFKAFLAEDVSPKEVSKIAYKMGPKKLILRLNGTEGVASDKELKRYNPAWTSALLKEYLDSKGAKKVTAATYTRVAAAKDDNGDAERLDQLVKQIRMLEEDVKEIEDDGDDATTERRHLESLRDEQRRLKEKMGRS